MLLLLFATTLSSCGGRPIEFPPPESEMPPAPGLFTGDAGAWEIPLVRDNAVTPPSSGARR